MKHLHHVWLVLAGLSFPVLSQAQTLGGVRIGTAGAPDASAVLDLRPDAATAPKSLLPPRLTQAQRNAIGSPATGLVVYQTDGAPGLYTYSGAAWVLLNPDNLGNHTATRNLDLAKNLLVGDGGTQGLSVASTGRVGIGLGATGPATDLEIGGTAAPALRLRSTGNGLLSGASLQLRESDARFGWTLRHNSGAAEPTDPAGFTPHDRLVLDRLTPAASPAMTWDQDNGNVGIGTTTPTEKLEVVGSVKAEAVLTPATGTHNMLPVAYGIYTNTGAFNSDYSLQNSSGNVTVTRNVEGAFTLAITGVPSGTRLVVSANILYDNFLLLANPGYVLCSSTGNIQTFFIQNGAPIAKDLGFNFVVYKP